MNDRATRGGGTAVAIPNVPTGQGGGDPNGGINTGGGADWFGPGNPPRQTVPAEVQGRGWDFPAAYNLNYKPRTYKRVDFATLRALARNWDVLRTIIETRKDQMAALEWNVIVRDKATENGKAKAKDSATLARIAKIEAFFAKPYPNHDWDTWLRKILNDLLEIDAPAIYRRKNLGGGLFGLKPMDGATIKPVIDDWGDIPMAPLAGYQQYLKGGLLNYTSDDLIYRPRNPITDDPYGLGPVEQIMTVINIAIRRETWQLQYFTAGNLPDALIGTPNEWCYSEDTEVLTKRGWLRFADVDHTTDEFATRNTVGDFEWQRATGINISQFDGDMVAFKSDTIDVLVNPPHRMLIGTKRKNGTYQERIRLARDLLAEPRENDRIPVHSKWVGESVGEKVFSNVTPRGGGRDIRMTGDQFCAFMGAYLAEGSSNARNVMLTQRPDGRGFWAYRELLADILGQEPSYHRDSLVIGSAPLARYLKQFGTARAKFIPDEIMEATVEQIATFLRFFEMGDGTADGRVIHTSSRRMADQLQELIQKAGGSASVRTDDRRGRVANIGNRTLTTENVHYVVGRSAGAYRRFKASPQPYSGTVACVSVPNGILYVRRNGKPCWSGNTPDQIRNFQDWFDARLRGNTEQRRGATFVPGDVAKGIVQTKDTELFGAAEDWMARVACFAFSISPQGFVKMQNRATASTAKETALQEGLEPLKKWVANLINMVIAEDFQSPDLMLAWAEEVEIDPQIASAITDQKVRSGRMTLNEARKVDGADPYDPKDVPEANIPLVLTATGFTPVGIDAQIEQQQKKQDAFPPPPPPPPGTLPGHGAAAASAAQYGDKPAAGKEPSSSGGSEAAKPGASGGGKAPEKAASLDGLPPGCPIHKVTYRQAPNGVKPITIDRPAGKRAIASIEKAFTKAFKTTADDVAGQVFRALRKEKMRKAADDHDDLTGAAAGGVQLSTADVETIVGDIDLSSLDVVFDAVEASLFDLSADSGLKALAQVGVKSTDALVDQVNDRAVAFAGQRAAELVGKRLLEDGTLVDNPNAKWAITDSTRDMIRTTIERGLKDNIGTRAIADNIQASTAFSKERAQNIASNEVANANEQSKLDGYRDAEKLGIVLKKIWLTAEDDDVDEEICQPNGDEGAIGINEDFQSGDSAPPGHNRCRCTVIPVVEDDQGGDDE